MRYVATVLLLTVWLTAVVAAGEPPIPGEQPPCTISGTSAAETLFGTKGRDVICGNGGDDRIFSRAGNDVIFGGAGDDVIGAGGGKDSAHGGLGSDAISGGSGDDRLHGQGGADNEISGDGGADLLRGGKRRDACLDAQDARSNDRVVGGTGSDGYAVDDGDVLISVERDLGVCAIQFSYSDPWSIG